MSYRERRKWCDAEDEKLLKLVTKYGAKYWTTIANKMETRDAKQCRERWVNHLDPDVKKDPLSDTEWRIVVEEQKRLGNKFFFFLVFIFVGYFLVSCFGGFGTISFVLFLVFLAYFIGGLRLLRSYLGELRIRLRTTGMVFREKGEKWERGLMMML
eukprot:TRINITY_DN364_c0_g1_i1.p1 TRINITY_DN364_c0_g1~~TRINITY_DN364_c0_g1_i1.p1  ORF type:complete len:174 (+),score=28.03 TRINITY_DN364_c0_g1_i1:57-524(+)